MRLFVALDLPYEVRRCIAAWAASSAPPGVRMVPEGNLHVTLAFLGERPDSDAEHAGAVVRATARPVGELRTAGALWLPSRRPGVLAVALAADAGLAALQSELVESLAQTLDWVPERRRFRPHVTVGRVRRGDRIRGGDLDLAPTELAFVPKAVVLHRSRTGPGGSRYEPLAQAVLGDAHSDGETRS